MAFNFSNILNIAGNWWKGAPASVYYDMYENDTDFDNAATNFYDTIIEDEFSELGEEDFFADPADQPDDEFLMEKAIYQVDKPDVLMTPYGPALSPDVVASVIEEYPAIMALAAGPPEDFYDGWADYFDEAESFSKDADDEINQIMDAVENRTVTEGKIGEEPSILSQIGQQAADGVEAFLGLGATPAYADTGAMPVDDDGKGNIFDMAKGVIGNIADMFNTGFERETQRSQILSRGYQDIGEGITGVDIPGIGDLMTMGFSGIGTGQEDLMASGVMGGDFRKLAAAADLNVLFEPGPDYDPSIDTIIEELIGGYVQDDETIAERQSPEMIRQWMSLPGWEDKVRGIGVDPEDFRQQLEVVLLGPLVATPQPGSKALTDISMMNLPVSGITDPALKPPSSTIPSSVGQYGPASIKDKPFSWNWMGPSGEDYADLLLQEGYQPPKMIDQTQVADVSTGLQGTVTGGQIVDAGGQAVTTTGGQTVTTTGGQAADTVTDGTGTATTKDALSKAEQLAGIQPTGEEMGWGENLKKIFYQRVYTEPGAGRADIAKELPDLFAQTRAIFLMKYGEALYANIKILEDEGIAQGMRDRLTASLEDKYRAFLNGDPEQGIVGYMNNPAYYTDNPDIKASAANIAGILMRHENEPDHTGWTETENDQWVWVEGLFGKEQYANKKALIKLRLTGSGMGNYSKAIHNAADRLMGYYRNVGKSEAWIFQRMMGTSGEEVRQAAAADTDYFPETAEDLRLESQPMGVGAQYRPETSADLRIEDQAMDVGGDFDISAMAGDEAAAQPYTTQQTWKRPVGDTGYEDILEQYGPAGVAAYKGQQGIPQQSFIKSLQDPTKRAALMAAMPEPFDETEAEKKAKGLPYNQLTIVNGKKKKGSIFVPTVQYGIDEGIFDK